MTTPSPTPPPLNTDPGVVLKAIGGFCLCSSVVLVGLAFALKLEMRWYHVVMVAIPALSGLIMLSDKVRDGVLNIASRMPFVNFTRADGGDGK